jgi:putative FmdB family regulatory protein
LALEVCECQEETVPTYQYACTACGHQLEAVQSFADEPLTECPACEGRLRKLFSSVGVVFKGSGFYRNDSRTGSGSTRDGGAKDSAPKDSAPKESSAKDGAPKESPAAKEGASSKDAGSTATKAPAKTPATPVSS